MVLRRRLHLQRVRQERQVHQRVVGVVRVVGVRQERQVQRLPHGGADGQERQGRERVRERVELELGRPAAAAEGRPGDPERAAAPGSSEGVDVPRHGAKEAAATAAPAVVQSKRIFVVLRRSDSKVNIFLFFVICQEL